VLVSELFIQKDSAMVKIEDFISEDELNNMSVREREITEQVF